MEPKEYHPGKVPGKRQVHPYIPNSIYNQLEIMANAISPATSVAKVIEEILTNFFIEKGCEHDDSLIAKHAPECDVCQLKLGKLVERLGLNV